MRIVGLLTFVCLLLLMAMIPACLQFARMCGVNPPAGTAMVVAAVLLSGMAMRR